LFCNQFSGPGITPAPAYDMLSSIDGCLGFDDAIQKFIVPSLDEEGQRSSKKALRHSSWLTMPLPAVISLVQQRCLPYTLEHKTPYASHQLRSRGGDSVRARSMQGSSRGSPGRASRGSPGRQRSSDWFGRHHVCGSKANTNLPKLQRIYFDDIPQARSSFGGVAAVPGHRSRNFDHFSACPPGVQKRELLSRFERYPFLACADDEGPLVESLNINGGTSNCSRECSQSPERTDRSVNRSITSSATGSRPATSDSKFGPRPVTSDSAECPTRPGTSDTRPATSESHMRPAASARGRMGSQTAEAERARSRKRREPDFPGDAPGAHNIFFEFHNWCFSKFQSRLKLWKVLDAHMDMRVGSNMFQRSLRDLGFSGDTRKLFSILDRDNSGTLKFHHFDPDAALGVAEFCRWGKESFQCPEELIGAVGLDKGGRFVPEHFYQRCQKLGFTNKQKAQCVAQLLAPEGSGTISRSEVLQLLKWDFPDWLAVEPDAEAATALKKKLINIYHGNALLAWRRILDTTGTMRVAWLEFRNGCRKAGCTPEELRKLPAAWRALDDNLSGWMSLREFDNDMHELLAKFVNWTNRVYGSTSKAFKDLDDNGNGRISNLEFRRACQTCDQDFSEEEANHLFWGLDLDQQGNVTSDEVRFLDRWKVDADIEEDKAWSALMALHQQPHRN